METEKLVVCCGFSVFDGLTLVFAALKLVGIVDWPWWAVTLPLWGPLGLIFVLMAPFLVVRMVNWMKFRAIQRENEAF